MKYYRNTQLAKMYYVSEKSVRNWIQAALEGKLEFELHYENGKPYIANTSKNMRLMEQQVQRGKKYKNTRAFKTITPTKEFYKIFRPKQVIDIISNLNVHHEIPFQYSYVDGGAEYWDQYARRLANEQHPNFLSRTLELLDLAAHTLDQMLDSDTAVNVIDLGPGNGLPVRPTLARLVKQGRLKRYIAIDISQDVLDILERNIKEWFNDAVTFEGHVRDFSYERFDDLFADDYSNGPENVPANLVFLLGGTLNNFRSPNQILHAINNSMEVNDILIYGGYLDTPFTRRYFDFDFDASGKAHKLAPQDKIILDSLGIDETLYEVEQIYSEERKARTTSILPKVDLSIKFELKNGTRYVELRKNEPILLWRSRHYDSLSLIHQFDETDFKMVQATKSVDEHCFILISKIKTEN